MSAKAPLVPVERIERAILFIRGQKVMLDADLARLYGVTTGRLNEQVRRNLTRFPEDFMFQLTKEELEVWRSQIAISNPAAKMGLRRRPFAFTEHGALMAANVLKTSRAVEMSVLVVRAFVRLREMLASHRELAEKLRELDRRVSRHDVHIRALVTAIRKLTAPSPVPPHRRIGFHGEK